MAQPPFINNFKATPLMIGGVLYLNTPLSIGAALDARTGATRWVYNPKSYEAGTTTHEPAMESAGRRVLDGWHRTSASSGEPATVICCRSTRRPAGPSTDFGEHGRD